MRLERAVSNASTSNPARKLEEHDLRLTKREDILDRKLRHIISQGKASGHAGCNKLVQRDKQMAAKDEQLTAVLKEQRDRLLQIAGMSSRPGQGNHASPDRVTNANRKPARSSASSVEQAQEEAKEKSRNIILQAIQRYAADQTPITRSVPSTSQR